jgi:hypothetical protein
MAPRGIKFGVSVCAHNESDYISYCLKSVYDFAHVVVVSVNIGIPWGGQPEPLDDTLGIVLSFSDPAGKIRIITGEWADEMEQRTMNFNLVKQEGANYFMTVDADEVYSEADLARLRKFVAMRPFIGQYRIRMRTYWKINPFHVIDPPEPYRRYLVSRLRPSTKLIGFSQTNERLRCTIPLKVAVFHHFSYARTDESIRRKLVNSSHAADFVAGWYENVWLAWDSRRDMENLHPMHPEEFKRAVPVNADFLPEVMREHRFAKLG